MFAAITAWCLALTIGQAPQGEAKRLDAIPPDVQIVARLRGLRPARDDLVKMLEAMSPNLAETARPSIDEGLKSVVDHVGKPFATAPMFIAVRLPDAGVQDVPPKIVVLLESNDYAGTLKALAGNGKPVKKKSGVDAFGGPNGAPAFAAKGSDFVAIGSDENFVAEIVKPKEQGIGRTITGAARERLFEGELGIYLNLAAIQNRFGPQIDQAREDLQKQMSQQTEGNPAGDFAKSILDTLFKGFKTAEGLALSVDFAPGGLIIKGDAILKRDSPALKTLATAKTGDAANLGRLPASLSNFTFMRARPGGTDAMLRAGAALMMSSAAKDTEAFRKATALMREAGAREGYNATVVNIEKPASLAITSFNDPRKGVEAMLADLQALKEGKGLIKEVEIAAKPTKYRGFEFREVRVTIDLDKLNQANKANPAAAAMPKPPAQTTSWFGTDGKVVLNAGAPTWEEAKARIDAYLDGKGTIGAVKGFQAARKLLPAQVGSIFLFNAQSLAGDFIKGTALAAGRDAAPPKLPADPVFLGASLGPDVQGYHFRLVVPNDVGPVIEQALSALRGQAGGVQQ